MNLPFALKRALVPPSARSGANMRAPIVGASMVGRYNGINGVMLSEWDAEASIHQAFLANWAVYRCVTINANAIAKLPFRAGKDPDKPDLYNPNAPLAQLLGPARPTTKRRVTGPNIDTSPHQLFAHAIASYMVTGRFGWEIEWSGRAQGSKVVALWPLIAQYLWPKPTPPIKPGGPIPPTVGEPPPRYFSAFEYRSQPSAPKELNWDQCFYHWRPSQHDWRQPESPLQSARMDIAGMIEQSIYDFAFLKNGAVPASLVVTQQFGSAADFEKFKAQWGYRYGGSANAGKTGFVEMDAEDGNVGQMVDVKVLGATMRDAQSDARYDAKVKAICQALGVPQSKLDASGRTYSNAGVEDETWEEDTIIPLALELQAAINLRLAPLVGDEVGWFDLSGLKTQQGQSFWVSVSPLDTLEKGAISLNEFRTTIGESRIDDPLADKVRYLENPALPEHHQETDRLDLTVASADAAQTGEVQPEQQGSGVDDKDLTNKPTPPVEVKNETDLNTQTQSTKKSAPQLERATLQSGIMVAFMIDPDAAKKLAVDGGEPPSQLHVTLAYLGKSTNNIDKEVLESTVREYAANQPPLAGKVAGAGVFDLPDGWAVVGLIDAPGLDEIRHGLVSALEKSGIAVANEHSYTPHITIKYVNSLAEAAAVNVPTSVPLIWNKMTISWGAQSIDCPLSARRIIPAGGLRDFSPLLGAHGADSLPEGPATVPAPGREIAGEVVNECAGQWQNSLLSLFDKQRIATLDRLEGKRGRQMLKRAAGGSDDVSAIFQPEFWVKEAGATFVDLYRSSATAMLGSVELDSLAESDAISNFIEINARDVALLLCASTYRAIQGAVSRGVADDGDTKAEIESVFDLLAQNDAKRIANAFTTELAGSLKSDLIARAQREGREYRSVADVEAELLALAAGASK